MLDAIATLMGWSSIRLAVKQSDVRMERIDDLNKSGISRR